MDYSNTHPASFKIPVRHSYDQETRVRIHKHLTDINDIITEEDIRNIKIGIPAANPALIITRETVLK
jgi:hypothetical protein